MPPATDHSSWTDPPSTRLINKADIKVLLIEDDEQDADQISLLMAQATAPAYAINRSATIAQGEMELSGPRHYDICLLDCDLRGRDVIAFAKRYYTEGGKVPMILLANQDSKALDQAAMDAGIAEFLPKCYVSPWTLDHTIRYTIARSTALQVMQRADRRHRQAVTAAAAVQQSLLPTKLPGTDRIRWYSRYHPAEELCGDTYDAFAIDERYQVFYQVDVSGHGIPAAMLAVQVARLLSSRNHTGLIDDHGHPLPPHLFLQELNRQFIDAIPVATYFTMIYGVIDLMQSSLWVANAGHRPPIITMPDGSLQDLDLRGNGIGMFNKANFGTIELQLRPGQRCIIYSDGIIEASRSIHQESFGRTRLHELLTNGARNETLNQTLDMALDTVLDWCQPHRPTDDCSLLAFEIPEEHHAYCGP